MKKEAIFNTHPVDLEPVANATCVVIMFAGQGYDVLPVSESRQAHSTSAASIG